MSTRFEIPPQEPGRPFAGFEPFEGAVVVARMRLSDDIEGIPKQRPGLVLNSPRPGVWSVLPFTTLKLYADGTRRQRVTDDALIGLDGSFLWGSVIHVAEGDILGVVWAAPLDMLVTVISALHGNRTDPIQRAVEIHRRLVDAGWSWPKTGYENQQTAPVPRHMFLVRPVGKTHPLLPAETREEASAQACTMSRRDMQTWAVVAPVRNSGGKRRTVERYAAGMKLTGTS